MKKTKRSIDAVLKMRTIMYFCIPLVLMAVIIIVNYILEVANYYRLYEDFYFEYFDEIFTKNDEDINYIINMVDWLADDDFEEVFKAKSVPEDHLLVNVGEKLNRFKNSSNIIKSMEIVNREADFVMSTSGKYELTEYFYDIVKYSDYSREFWAGYKNTIGNIKILPPTEYMAVDGEKRYVMPIVFSSVKNFGTSNLFIIDIDISRVIEKNAENKFTSDTSIYFVNKKTKNMYSKSDYMTDVFEEDSEIWKKIVWEDRIRMRHTGRDKQKYLVLSHTMSPNLDEYAYVILMPEKGIRMMVNAHTYKIVMVTLLMFGILWLISLYLVKKLHIPFASILGILPEDAEEIPYFTDIGKKIEDAVNKLSEEKTSLKENISKAEQVITERQIIDILNDKPTVPKLKIFKYNSFFAVAIKLKWDKKKNSQTAEYYAFYDRIYEIIKSYFRDKYDIYALPTDKDGIHLLMNLPEDITEDYIEAELNAIKKIIHENEPNINMKTYTGGICRGIEGLKETCKRVNEQINSLDFEALRNVKLEDIITENVPFYYKPTDESTIINNMVAGNYENVCEYVEKIMVYNIMHEVSPENMKGLYVNIIHAIFIAFSVKGFDISNLLEGKKEIEVYGMIKNMSESQICELILNLLEMCASRETDNGTIKIEDAMEYILQHYQDSALCLDSVAEHFNTNARYISKLFKKKSDIQFHDYLTGIRIEKAKDMLVNTDMTIEAIYKQVGYQSRTTFIRAFKSIGGLTPTEYRIHLKEQKREE